MNSDLYGNIIGVVPQNVLLSIKKALDMYPNAIGNERANNILVDNNMSYSNAKKIKSYLDNFSQSSDSIETYELSGGKLMLDWLNQILRNKRSSIDLSKKTKSLVFNNQFKKTHNKDGITSLGNKLTKQMDNVNSEIKRIEESEAYQYLFEELERDLSIKPKESSVGVILNNEEKILLLKRNNDTNWMPNKWSLVGGKKELNESSDDCIKRECKEETKLDVSTCKYIFKKQESGFNVSFYLCRTSNENDVKICEESLDFKWVSLNEINDLDGVPDLKTDIMTCLINQN